VIYPLFAKVRAEDYIDYHKSYSSWIPLPVILPGFASFFLPIALANAACGLLSLIVTVALQIPRHARLEKGSKQESTIQQLISYNWLRTFGITGSACLTIAMLTRAFAPVQL
jgi:hypothetical protein